MHAILFSSPIAGHCGTMQQFFDSGDGLEVVAGCIFWLPAKNDCDECLVDNRELNDGCFNHPVLILTADCNLQMAVILIVN